MTNHRRDDDVGTLVRFVKSCYSNRECKPLVMENDIETPLFLVGRKAHFDIQSGKMGVLSGETVDGHRVIWVDGVFIRIKDSGLYTLIK